MIDERADENDLPGRQDQGGKHGGQKDGPRPAPPPPDVVKPERSQPLTDKRHDW